MERYPLTSYGVSVLQEVLYSLEDEELRAEAEALAADPCAWIASHMELEVYQLECLRLIEEGFMQMFGWNTAAALLGRRPITLSYRTHSVRNDPDKSSCMLYNCRVLSHYDDEITTSIGSLDIVFTHYYISKPF